TQSTDGVRSCDRGAGAINGWGGQSRGGGSVPYKRATQVFEDFDCCANSQEPQPALVGRQTGTGFGGNCLPWAQANLGRSPSRNGDHPVLLGALVRGLQGRGPHSGALKAGVRRQAGDYRSDPAVWICREWNGGRPLGGDAIYRHGASEIPGGSCGYAC